MKGKKLKPNEYQCAECRGIFKKGWSDKEQLEEKEKLFGDVPIEDCATICDDCWQELFN